MTRLPSLGPRGEGWVAMQFALLAAIAAAGPWTAATGSGPAGIALVVLGGALIVLGGALALRGAVDLRDALTPLPHPRADAELVEHGLYARVRHPMYGGLIMAAVGWGLVWASPTALILAGGLAVFFLLKSTREEAWLVERFPGYVAYRRRTRRFLLLPSRRPAI